MRLPFDKVSVDLTLAWKEGGGTMRSRSSMVSAQFMIAGVGIILLFAAFVLPIPLRAASTTLVINEVLYDPTDEPAGEFVEIYVKSSPGNLSGYQLTDQDTHTYTFPSFTPSDGDYVVVHTGSGTDDTNGPVIHLYWGLGYAIWNNGGDDVLLTDGTNGIDYIAYGSDDGIDSPPSGLSWSGPNPSSDTEGTSISLINNGVDGDSGNGWEKSGTTSTYDPTTEGKNNNQDPTTITLSSFTARPTSPHPTSFHWQWLALAGTVGLVFGEVAVARRWLRR